MRKFSALGMVLLASTLLPFPAHSQEPSLEDWYQVEVIVFSQRDLYGAEGYPRNPELRYPPRLQFLKTGEQLFQRAPPGAGYNETLAALMVPQKFLSRESAKTPASFVPLEKERRNLGPEAYTLGRGGDYRVLFHAAWLQPVNGRRASPWVHITGGESFDDHRELEGSIQVYRSRYLHIDFNLWLGRFTRAGIPPQENPKSPPETPPLLLPDSPSPPASPALQRLRMLDPLAAAPHSTGEQMPGPSQPSRQYTLSRVDVLDYSQQLAVDSLTYIDHPRLGALVLVTALEKEEEETPTELD